MHVRNQKNSQAVLASISCFSFILLPLSSLNPFLVSTLTAPAICRTEGSLWAVGVAGLVMWSVAQYVYYGFCSNLRSDISAWKTHTQDGVSLQPDENSSRSLGFTLLFRQAWKKPFRIQAALISQCLKCLKWQQKFLFSLIVTQTTYKQCACTFFNTSVNRS